MTELLSPQPKAAGIIKYFYFKRSSGIITEFYLKLALSFTVKLKDIKKRKRQFCLLQKRFLSLQDQ